MTTFLHVYIELYRQEPTRLVAHSYAVEEVSFRYNESRLSFGKTTVKHHMVSLTDVALSLCFTEFFFVSIFGLHYDLTWLRNAIVTCKT